MEGRGHKDQQPLQETGVMQPNAVGVEAEAGGDGGPSPEGKAVPALLETLNPKGRLRPGKMRRRKPGPTLGEQAVAAATAAPRVS